MMPVTYHQGQNGSYTLNLMSGSFQNMSLEHEGYAIMAAAMVGNREFSIGFDPKAPARYSVWERMPNRTSSPAHAFHNGSYHTQYAEAMKDCETRIIAAYAKRCRQPHKKQKGKNHTERER